MKIYLDSIGCRLNQAEIEQYARQFCFTGHELVATPNQADLAVINTCTVTAEAASDSRQKIRQAARAGVNQVVVTGCWATLSPQEALGLPAVSQVIANASKDHLVASLLQLTPEFFDQQPLERKLVPGARLRTRAFIKVQDGCDNHCTFCITTLARGNSRSRPIKVILADIHAALAANTQEVVMSGVHLGAWGQDFSPPQTLSYLLRAILEQTDVQRLRLSSLEPWDIEPDFFNLWQDSRLAPHLHLPLQSGCATTLRRMARKTTPQNYSALLSIARAAIPDVAITTDLISGFPGESENEFSVSLDFVRQMAFADGHVFTYSARPGTAAAKMPDQVPHSVRKFRNAQLRAALAESAAAYRARFVDHILPVLWENATSLSSGGWKLSGLTGNYLRVHACGSQHLWNQITPVRLTGLAANGLEGEIIG